eukprot:SAG31_NODE_1120_length_9805_cov_8.220173_2_plen_75_part_00
MGCYVIIFYNVQVLGTQVDRIDTKFNMIWSRVPAGEPCTLIQDDGYNQEGLIIKTRTKFSVYGTPDGTRVLSII